MPAHRAGCGSGGRRSISAWPWLTHLRHPDRSLAKRGVVEGPLLEMHHQKRSLDFASLRSRRRELRNPSLDAVQVGLARRADGEHDLDAADDVVEAHRRGAADPRGLLGQVWDVQEAASVVHLVRLGHIHGGVEDVVADEGAGAVRYRRRQTGLAHLGDARLDRQGREIGRRAFAHHRPVDRLLAVVVADARVLDVDRHPLEAELGAAARLPHAQHDVGLDLVDRRPQHNRRAGVGGRQLDGVDRDPVHPPLQAAHGKDRRIDLVAAERIEPGDQCLHAHTLMPTCAPPFSQKRRAPLSERPLNLAGSGQIGYLLAWSTARRAITVTRWARYSALPWMSLFRPSAGTLMSLIASEEKFLASASSIALTRNTHGPAPVTATRTLLPVLATNTPTMA